jgi:hypothetical protein
MKKQLNNIIPVSEGFSDAGLPDMKYYAFDWDDNVVHMPTEIIVKNSDGDEIGMSTEDFAEYRSKIGKEPFDYRGQEIVGYSDDPFKNFRTEGDAQFLKDISSAKLGPAWEDFREAINNGSIFAIITARGHNPFTLRKAVKKYIDSGYGGIDKKQLVKNLRKYRDFVGEDDMGDEEMIDTYLSLNKYHPVSFGTGAEANPEELKVEAMKDFEKYVRGMAGLLEKTYNLVSDLGFKFTPSIGFSDDDPKNVEVMKKNFYNKPDSLVNIYSTTGGVKKKEAK